MGSMLGPNRVIAKDVKVVPTAAMSDVHINIMSKGNAKQAQLSTMHS